MNGMELKKLMDVTVAKAVKEFAEKLKETLIINNEENTEIFDYQYTLETIDELLKEYEK